MKLYFAPPSPFARKARTVVLEKGLEGRIELVAVSPLEDPPALLAANPLGKIPALALDDGTSVYDSPVICEYLDSLAPQPPLYVTGTGRFVQQRRLALVDGLLDAAVAVRLEAMRPPERQHVPWMDRQRRAVTRALGVLESEREALATPDMVHLAAVIALEYLDFRLPELDWRAAHPQLAAWHAQAHERPSLAATRPPA
jgi:glutathione S-transferase